MSKQLIETLARLEHKIDLLLTVKGNQQWLSASEVRKATGWDKEVLRRKRESGAIVFKRSPGGGYLYQHSVTQKS